MTAEQAVEILNAHQHRGLEHWVASNAFAGDDRVYHDGIPFQVMTHVEAIACAEAYRRRRKQEPSSPADAAPDEPKPPKIEFEIDFSDVTVSFPARIKVNGRMSIRNISMPLAHFKREAFVRAAVIREALNHEEP